MNPIGYAYLVQKLGLSAFEPARTASIAPVTRVTTTADALLVPSHVAPKSSQPLEHILFALKHEGINLPILAQSLRRILDATILDAVKATPSGSYIRIAGFLWEAFNHRKLANLPAIAGPTVDLFDPRHYLTGPTRRSARWRVNFNGLGTIKYCATVERTENIETLLGLDILARTEAFLAELGPVATDRAISWAYPHETESSFAIERETPTADKAETFVALLKQAHQPRPLDETYLVELQNAAITNPLDKAATFRHQQNWLRGPLRGAAGITYLPPPPEWVAELMEELLTFISTAPKQIDPLVAAAIASFAFVFIHPFMDGNGRLSRFLFHYVLCQSGRLEKGLLLPVSVAMKRNEEAYLQALQSFSMPMRRRWQVRWIGDEDYDFHYQGDDTLYRYWNATSCVEFGLQMAQQALEKDLREETEFLAHYDAIYKAINEYFDVRGNDLTALILSCMQNNGKVSKHRRKQFRLSVPEPVFDAIEKAHRQTAPAPSPLAP